VRSESFASERLERDVSSRATLVHMSEHAELQQRRANSVLIYAIDVPRVAHFRVTSGIAKCPAERVAVGDRDRVRDDAIFQQDRSSVDVEEFCTDPSRH
jgi:hypothetical protein